MREVCDEAGLSPNGVHIHLRRARSEGWAETDGKARGWRLTAAGRLALRVATRVERMTP